MVENKVDDKTQVDAGMGKDPLVGAKVGKYHIAEKLGEGGTAVVYKAVDTVLHREVAIKILHEHLKTEDAVIKRFEREAQTIAQLSHPNVLEVFDLLKHEGKEIVVVEYMPGSTCSDLIRLKRKIPEPFVIMLGLEVLKGLRAAHKKGVIHRDIKPANILINPEIGVKVSDFGLAKQLEQDEELTKDGMFVGTPSFASPEQIEGRKLDAKSDLFSVGVMLYVLATQTHPFKERGDSVTTVWFKISQGKFTRSKMRQSNLSDDFDKVIAKALNVDPTQRYQTADAMIDDLAMVLQKGRYIPYEEQLKKFLRDPEHAKPEKQGVTFKQVFMNLLSAKPKAVIEDEISRSIMARQKSVAGTPDQAQVQVVVRDTGDSYLAKVVRTVRRVIVAFVLLAAIGLSVLYFQKNKESFGSIKERASYVMDRFEEYAGPFWEWIREHTVDLIRDMDKDIEERKRRDMGDLPEN